MQTIRNIVLGAGISGLALAHDLKRRGQEVIILEKNRRAGGWVGTDTSSGFLFERGPRTFRTSSSALLTLAEQLHLNDELIFSAPKARYLYIDGKLRKAPGLFVFSKLLPALLREWSIAPSSADETIYAFASRRFGPSVAELLFDPLTLGIYAGDIHTLSIRSCFPQLKQAEEQYGSLTRAFFNREKKPSGLFSFRNGTQTLIDALENALSGNLFLDEEVVGIQQKEAYWSIRTAEREWRADRVFSALPPAALGQLLPLPWKVEMKGIEVVHIGYDHDVLPCDGFGYLIPTREKEQLLGVVFDSKIFPQQNRHPQETRLTAMIRENSSDASALDGLKRHLGITQTPAFIRSEKLTQAIPQFGLHHHIPVNPFPHFYLTGNYLHGASVNDCIAGALKISATCCS
jgi:oxygen-dependent protoporphyrinogen oxidase